MVHQLLALDLAARPRARRRACVECARAHERLLRPRPTTVAATKRRGARTPRRHRGPGRHGRAPRSAGGRDVDDEIGLVMLTSGSSGPPKAAELTWAALRASAATHPSVAARRPGARVVSVPAREPHRRPRRAAASGPDDASLLWGDDGDLERAAPAARRTSHWFARSWLATTSSGYHRVLLGGARPPRRTPANVVTTWGMTETGSGVVYDGYPLDGVELVAVDGELCVRTPTLFRSYRGAPRPHVMGPDGRDDWFPTGDAGEVVDGRVTRVRPARLRDQHRRGEGLARGPRGAPRTLAGVRDVAVTGVDDPEWGQRVVALVVSRRRAARRRDAQRSRPSVSARGRSPRRSATSSAIPRTGNGKIRRGDLDAPALIPASRD